MAPHRIFLPIAVIGYFAFLALPEKAIAAEDESRPFVIEQVTFEDQEVAGGEAVDGLMASLERARRNGVQGVQAQPRTISLDRALWLAEWRRGVAQELSRILP